MLVLLQGKQVLVLVLRRVRGKQVLVQHDQCAEVHILRAVPRESVLHLLGIQVRHDQCAEAHTLRAVRNKRGLRLSGMRGLHGRRAEAHILQAVLHE